MDTREVLGYTPAEGQSLNFLFDISCTSRLGESPRGKGLDLQVKKGPAEPPCWPALPSFSWLEHLPCRPQKANSWGVVDMSGAKKLTVV